MADASSLAKPEHDPLCTSCRAPAVSPIRRAYNRIIQAHPLEKMMFLNTAGLAVVLYYLSRSCTIV